MKKEAVISDCLHYRYWLTRSWGPGKLLVFCMLNPSKADAEIDDATIRRCMWIASRLGYHGIIVVNMFAFRAINPQQMLNQENPRGSENDYYLAKAASYAANNKIPIVLAWGNLVPEVYEQSVILLFKSQGASLKCLAKTKMGHPHHPLRMTFNGLKRWP